jgi:beta-phosphoglucomutase
MYKLREEHIHIAVATSTKRTIAVEILQKVGVYTLVDVLVGGDEIIKGKPNPEIFLTAAERLDVAPENCIVFEDSLAGVQAGLKAHMHVVAMLTSHRKEEFPEVKQTLHDFVGVGVKSFLEEIVR